MTTKNSGTRRARVGAKVSSNALTPESGLSITLKQALVVGAIVAGAGSGYGYLVYTQSTQGAAINEIKTTQAVNTVSVLAVAKEQEEKRTALGKEFIESNRAIVTAIGELKTLSAVQQERQKTTDEKLSKVLDQIGAALQPPARR